MNRTCLACLGLVLFGWSCSGEGQVSREMAANDLSGSSDMQGASTVASDSATDGNGAAAADQSASGAEVAGGTETSAASDSDPSQADAITDSTATSDGDANGEGALPSDTNAAGDGTDPVAPDDAGTVDATGSDSTSSDSTSSDAMSDSTGSGDTGAGGATGEGEPASESGGSGAGGSEPDREACPSDECGGVAILAPNILCADGSTGGPVCERNLEGVCAWTIRDCPVDTPSVEQDPGDTTACETSEDCVACDTSDAADSGSCVCPGCPAFPVNAATCRKRQQAFQSCAATVLCPQVLCTPPPTVECVEKQCVVTGTATL